MDVILHCSDSEFGNALEIDRWHKERGFKCIGYHFVILNGCYKKNKYSYVYDGLVDSGRYINDKGAHCRAHNNTIGICLIGKTNDFTSSQMMALVSLLRLLEAEYGEINIKQHSDYDNKKPHCAGLPINILTQIKEAL